MGFADNVSLSRYGTYKKVFETDQYDIDNKNFTGAKDQKETLELEDDFQHLMMRLHFNVELLGQPAYVEDCPDFARTLLPLKRLKMYPAKRNTRYMEMKGIEYLYYQAMFTRDNFLFDTMPTGAQPAAPVPMDIDVFIPHVGYHIKEFGEMEIEFDIADELDIEIFDENNNGHALEFTDIQLIFYAFYGEPTGRIFTGTPFTERLQGIRQKQDGLTKGLSMVGQIINGYNSDADLDGVISKYDFRQAGGDIIVADEPDARLLSQFNFHSLINPFTYRDLMGFDLPKAVNVGDTTLFYITDVLTFPDVKDIRIIPLYEDNGA